MRVLVSFPDEAEIEYDWQPLPRGGEFISIDQPDEHAGDYRVLSVTWIVESGDFYPMLTLTDDLEPSEPD